MDEQRPPGWLPWVAALFAAMLFTAGVFWLTRRALRRR